MEHELPSPHPRLLMPARCRDSAHLEAGVGVRDLSTSPNARKVCSRLMREEALRDARARTHACGGRGALHAALI